MQPKVPKSAVPGNFSECSVHRVDTIPAFSFSTCYKKCAEEGEPQEVIGVMHSS